MRAPLQWIPALGALAVVAALAGCGKAEQMAASDAMETAAPPAPAAQAKSAATDLAPAMLAYEHNASVTLEAAQIVPRLADVQGACAQRKFGSCVVLDVAQQGGSYPRASITVRVAPEGVEPLVALAGRGGEIGQRNTHAEDLAVAVRDNDQLQQRLKNERSQLTAFQKRRDLAVADMIALSSQLAEVEAQLQAAEQEGAQHRLRIDTQKLSIDFTPLSIESHRSEIMEALHDIGNNLTMGTAWTIRVIAFLIPVGLALLVIVGLWRWARRRNRK